MLSIFFYEGGVSLFILRVVIGAIFIVHGWPKLRNHKKTVEWFGASGFKPGWFWAPLVGILEFFGGIAILLGILVQPLVVLFGLQFITIILWKLAKRMPFAGGWEIDLLILAALIVLFFLGGGWYSFGHVLFL